MIRHWVRRKHRSDDTREEAKQALAVAKAQARRVDRLIRREQARIAENHFAEHFKQALEL